MSNKKTELFIYTTEGGSMITKTILWKTIRELLREDMRSKNLTKKVMEKIREQGTKESENK